MEFAWEDEYARLERRIRTHHRRRRLLRQLTRIAAWIAVTAVLSAVRSGGA